MSKRIHVRPGKSQSKVGFAMGIIFCLLGVFVVIPIFGLFGVFWTAFAGWITYVNYRNGFTDKQIDSKIIEIEEDGKEVTVTSQAGFQTFSCEKESRGADNEDIEERLKKLQNLYNQSLITMEEYEQKKKEILEEL